MADSSRTKRRRLTLIGSAAAALALSVSLAPGAVAGPPDSSPGASRAAAATQSVDVMTRNLYLGADLMPVIGALASDPFNAPAVAADTWANVQATHPPARMEAIADEITDDMPAMVGLQEVTTWLETSLTGTPVGGYDCLELLMDALDDRVADPDLDYEVVTGATSQNFASGPIPLGTTLNDITGYVLMWDSDVILRRGDVDAVPGSAMNGNFANKVVFPTGFGPIAVERGWGSVDVSVDETGLRFVNAHLEAFAPPMGLTAEEVRVLQAQELLDATYTDELPLVYVGDYNSTAPTGDAYQLLTTDLQDAIRGNSARGQATCCQNATLTNMGSELDKRIDLVLTSDDIKATRVVRTGTTPIDLPGDTRWASDHAGVVARLMFTG